MSSGRVPGSSGDSMIIYLLAGVAAFGGLFYLPNLSEDDDKIKVVGEIFVACMHFTLFIVLNKPLEGDGEETAEATEAEKATEEADAAAAVEPAAQDESAGPTAQDESAGPTAQDETSGVSPEAGGEDDLLAPEVSQAVEEAQQEAAANSEAAADLELAANSEDAAVQG
ncbi:hypothetical protein HGM15179_003795 [Zosterops borbonicus]|uniref:Uncharacterized protein n=1 Tax=Zosterops borbonicus TaxID=364589 RepID=A0A8K1GQ91_9PASS|nr:hypothetical protein HGM15179_003795 [Zosterops borbonicus]